MLTILFCWQGTVFSQDHEHSENNLIRFTENKSQWEENILYRAELDGGALYLEKNCFTYNFFDKEAMKRLHYGVTKGDIRTRQARITPLIKQHAFKATFLNALPSVNTVASNPSSDMVNYFLGNDKSKWAGNVRKFGHVYYNGMYDGIDIEVLGKENSMKYNFYVAPNANVNQIQVRYEGVTPLIKNGRLHFKTSINEVIEQAPYAYQMVKGRKVGIACNFVLFESIVTYEFPDGYDTSKTLVIDPVLVFAASSGSTADNFGMTATYDSDGNLYSGGTTFNQGYPTTLGAYDTTFDGTPAYGMTDVVITKYNPSGTALVYSTYFGGGSSSEIVTSIVVNAQNELLLYGATGSSDLPVSDNAYDKTFNGGSQVTFTGNGTWFKFGTDIYVAKLSPDGSTLLSSTYIGGAANDGINVNNSAELAVPTISASGWQLIPETDNIIQNGLATFQYVGVDLGGIRYGFAESKYDSLMYNYGDQYRGEINVDHYGNVCIATSTRSNNFPFKDGIDNSLGGKQDAAVFKMNADLSQLLWSTYLGGSDNDAGYALAIDDSSNVIVTGGSRASDYPTTLGTIQTTYNGGMADGYISKIKNDGSSLLASTMWGTPTYDQNYFVQMDRSGDIYVVGQSDGAMPVSAGVYNNANSGQFIAKFNDSLNKKEFSTIFGNGSNSPHLSPSAFMVDVCENIYVSGWTGDRGETHGMPLTPNANDSTTDGDDFYLFVLAPDADSLTYASYFGGGTSHEHVDGGTSRFDKRGLIYQSVCAGCGGNDDFPVTPGAWPNSGANVNHSTNCNNGVFKFDFQVPLVFADLTVNEISGCAPLTINFENKSTVGAPFYWVFEGNDTSFISNPTRTFNSPGTYLVRLIAQDTTSCNYTDSTFTYITVYDKPLSGFTTTINACARTVEFNDTSTNNPVNWKWYFGDGDSSSIQNPTHVYPDTGSYNVQLITTNINGCKDTLIKSVLLSDTLDGTFTYTVAPCTNEVQFSGAANIPIGNWKWYFGDGDSSSIQNPIHAYSDTGIYVVKLVVNSGVACVDTTENLVVLPEQIQSDFSYTIALCSREVAFSDSTTLTPINWKWYFGDGDSSTLQHPTHTYLNSATYTVVLVASNIHGCKDTVQKELTVPPLLKADFSFNVLPCTDTVNFFSTSSNGLITVYKWYFGDGDSSSLQNPQHIYNAASNYNVQLLVETNLGCKDTSIIKPVQILPPIAANFTYTVSPCTHTASFTDLSAVNPVSWKWYFGDGDSSSLPNPINDFVLDGLYTTTLSVSRVDGCSSTTTQIIELSDSTRLISTDTTICKDDVIQLSAKGGVSYNWSPGTSFNDSTMASPNFVGNTTTSVSLVINSINSQGALCSYSYSTAITVLDSNTFSIDASTDNNYIHPGQTTTIHAITNPSLPMYWASSTVGENVPDILDVEVSPLVKTTYTASFVGSNVGGCPIFDTVTIFIRECELANIFVPNTFTPNGDGSNDLLYVRGKNITELYFAVYNRWGEKVFETNDINVGWDGVYNEMSADPVVFAWYLTAKCYNGEEITKKGNVTLIR